MTDFVKPCPRCGRQNPEALAELLRGLLTACPEWDVILYSGYTLAEIRTGGGAAARVLDLIDVLIDGPYRRDEPPVHPLAGSGNQEILALSTKGRGLLKEMEIPPAAAFEIGLGKDETLLIGVGRAEQRAAVTRGLAGR